MKKNCLFVVQSHYPESHYMELNLELVCPFYLVTDGEKTIIERKIDELLDKYDGDIDFEVAYKESDIKKYLIKYNFDDDTDLLIILTYDK